MAVDIARLEGRRVRENSGELQESDSGENGESDYRGSGVE